jgi:hypothetical protein
MSEWQGFRVRRGAVPPLHAWRRRLGRSVDRCRRSRRLQRGDGRCHREIGGGRRGRRYGRRARRHEETLTDAFGRLAVLVLRDRRRWSVGVVRHGGIGRRDERLTRDCRAAPAHDRNDRDDDGDDDSQHGTKARRRTHGHTITACDAEVTATRKSRRAACVRGRERAHRRQDTRQASRAWRAR